MILNQNYFIYCFSIPHENLLRIDLSEDAINTGLVVVMANTEDFETLINSKELKISIGVSFCNETRVESMLVTSW